MYIRRIGPNHIIHWIDIESEQDITKPNTNFNRAIKIDRAFHFKLKFDCGQTVVTTTKWIMISFNCSWIK